MKTGIKLKNDSYVGITGSMPFKELPIGTLFVFPDDTHEHPRVWAKTPMADMYEHNNKLNQNGAFCSAVCVNASGEGIYIQCRHDADCLVIDTDAVFGTADND